MLQKETYKIIFREKLVSHSYLYSVQSLSCVQLFAAPCNMPGLPVHHQLPEFTQTHVHWVSDAIQPSHPLSSPSPLALNPSHHQGLSQWVNSSHEVAKVWSFSFNISPANEHSELISFRMDWLDLRAVQRDSQESSPTPQFKSIDSLVLNFLHSPTLASICDYWQNHSLD